MRNRERRAERIMAVGLVAVASAYLHAGWSLKPGLFEPIGSGTVPNSVAVLLILLSLAMLGESAWRARSVAASAEPAPPEAWRPTLAVFALTILYVFVLASGFVRYQWATLVYLPLAILLLSERPRAAAPVALAIGCIFAFGLDAIFRHVLVTDLP
jgi:hypothetical protein